MNERENIGLALFVKLSSLVAVKALIDRLNVNSTKKVSVSDSKLMATHNKKPSTKKLFSQRDIQVLEYAHILYKCHAAGKYKPKPKEEGIHHRN